MGGSAFPVHSQRFLGGRIPSGGTSYAMSGAMRALPFGVLAERYEGSSFPVLPTSLDGLLQGPNMAFRFASERANAFKSVSHFSRVVLIAEV
jgi:hypothetical protein